MPTATSKLDKFLAALVAADVLLINGVHLIAARSLKAVDANTRFQASWNASGCDYELVIRAEGINAGDLDEDTSTFWPQDETGDQVCIQFLSTSPTGLI